MAKQLMSFRFDDSIVNYLQGVVKNSDMSMTDYIVGIIEQDRDCDYGRDWESGCVIVSSGKLIVVDGAYNNMMISLIEGGYGIIAAIPESLIPLDKCIGMAKAQIRKDEDIVWNLGDEIHSIELVDPIGFAQYLADTFDVDVKSRILE